MKARAGFVSNSSTCSFLIYGIILGIDAVKARLHGKDLMPLQIEDEYEWFEDFFSKAGLFGEVIYEWGEIVIGRSWDSVKDEETGKQFKDSIVAALVELFGEEVREECKTRDGTYPC